MTGNDKIRAIIGGFHFNRMPEEEVVKQAEYFKSLNLEYLMPSHCTGVKQTEILQKLLPEKNQNSQDLFDGHWKLCEYWK